MTDFTKETFDEAVKAGVAVVDVWAEWCMPCKMFAPTFNKVAKQFDGKVTFGKINSEDEYELVSRLGVNALPTILYYKDGKNVGRAEGLMSESTLVQKIEELLK